METIFLEVFFYCVCELDKEQLKEHIIHTSRPRPGRQPNKVEVELQKSWKTVEDARGKTCPIRLAGQLRNAWSGCLVTPGGRYTLQCEGGARLTQGAGL